MPEIRSQTRSPTAASQSGSGILQSWSGLANVYASEDAWATVGLSGGTKNSKMIWTSGYGFTVPADSTIVGIAVDLERFAGSGVYLNKAKLSLVGSSDKAVYGDWQPSSEAVLTLGGAADTWSIGTVTPAAVNSSSFGFLLAASYLFSSGSATLFVDHIPITVYYLIDTPDSVAVAIAAQGPIGPPERAPTTSVTFAAQPPAIEQAATLSVAIEAQPPVQPIEKCESMAIYFMAFAAIGPEERAATNTIRFMAQDPIPDVEKLVLASFGFASDALTAVELSETHLGFFSGVHREELATTVMAFASESIAAPQAWLSFGFAAELLTESLEPTVWGFSSDVHGESERVAGSAFGFASDAIVSPCAATLFGIMAPPLAEGPEPVLATALGFASEELADLSEALATSVIGFASSSLFELIEPQQTTSFGFTSEDMADLSEPLATAVIGFASLSLVELIEPQPETSIGFRSVHVVALEAMAIGFYSAPLVPLPDQPITTSAFGFASNRLTDLSEAMATSVIGFASSSLFELIEPQQTTSFGFTSEDLADLSEPLATSVVGFASSSLVEVIEPQIETKIGFAITHVQYVEPLTTVALAFASPSITEVDTPLDGTSLGWASREQGVGYLQSTQFVFKSAPLPR